MKWSTIKKKIGNPTFFIFLLLFGIASPFALFSSAQTDEISVVTAVGIDLVEQDQVEVSVLCVLPSNANTGEMQNFQVFSAVGEDVSQCVFRLSLSIGKEIGLAQCESIVMSDKVLEQGVQPYLDFFMRSNNLTSNAFLINCPSESKELLMTVSKVKNNYNLSLRNVVFHLEDYFFTTNATIEHFYEKLYSTNTACLIPIIDVKKGSEPAFSNGEEKAQDSDGQSSSGASEGSESSSGSSGGEDSSNQGNSTNIRSEGKSAVVLNGKKVKELTKDQSYAMNIVSKESSKGILFGYDVTTKDLKNAKVTMEIEDNIVKYDAYFENGKPVFKVETNFICVLDSIVMEEYQIEDYYATTSYVEAGLEAKLQEHMQNIVSDLVSDGRSNKIDYMETYRYFEAYHPIKWKQFLNSLEDKTDYQKEIIFLIDVHIKTKI